jgi:site-specific DNA-cytosine methylase
VRDHVDLFSGIGGFTLAAHACGVRTIAFCESDPRCQAFLAKAWPGIPCWPDVRSFHLADTTQRGQRTDGSASGDTGHTDKQPQGVWLLTAGVPCQPASRAGKQRGAADDRWLWPATLAVLGDLQPTWAILENPPGIGDMDFAGILSQVEAHGYSTRVFSIPACAVGAPHRRERYWIVAHHAEDRRQHDVSASQGWGSRATCAEVGVVADAGLLGSGQDEPERGPDRRTADWGIDPWADAVWLPCADGKFRRAPGDAVELVDGLQWPLPEMVGPFHRSLLAALGNSIVWQVAARIIAAMVEAENESE